MNLGFLWETSARIGVGFKILEGIWEEVAIAIKVEEGSRIIKIQAL